MKKIITILAVSLIGVALAVPITAKILSPKIEKWDWSKIDVDDLHFPPNFIFGTASAAFQVEGGHDETDSWGAWESARDKDGKPIVREPAGIANNEWELYHTDLENMNDLGLDSYRFSLSWSKIEPQEGEYNEEALAHYDQLIDAIIASDMIPMVTLHHFSHPSWFEKKGAFDKRENVDDFVRFAKKVFDRYGDRVKFWVTFNEPVVYAYGRYIDLNFPTPFTEPDYNKMGNALRNTLIAHDDVYDAIKATANGKNAEVGIVKSFMQMDPASTWDLGDVIVAYYANKLFLTAYLNYFVDGTFDFRAFPVGADITYMNPKDPNRRIDFIGLNYYSHNAFDFNWTTLDLDEATRPKIFGDEIDTGLNYGYYPEGLYRAIEEASRVKKPIYITENGIGVPASQEDIRVDHLKTSLYDVSKAIKNGYDVRAFYYWSLNDNFEWEHGYSKTFGLMSVDRKTLERTPKEAFNVYKSVISKAKGLNK